MKLRLCTWLTGPISLLRFKVKRSTPGRSNAAKYISVWPTCGGACRTYLWWSLQRRRRLVWKTPHREENRGLPATFLDFTSANHGKFYAASKYPANRLTGRENSTLLSTARPRKIVENCATTQDGLSYAEFAEHGYTSIERYLLATRIERDARQASSWQTWKKDYDPLG